MPNKQLETQLDRLVVDTLSLGQEVEGTLTFVLRTLEDYDARAAFAASRQSGDETKFESRAEELDQACMLLQAQQAPVARDLRLLCAARALTVHLARTAALCGDVLRTVSDPPTGELRGGLGPVVPRMAILAHGIFREGLSAFEFWDTVRGQELRAVDDEVDLLYRKAIDPLCESSTDDVASPGTRVLTALVAHYLERIADHGVEIGELAIFVLEGERVRNPTDHRAVSRRGRGSYDG